MLVFAAFCAYSPAKLRFYSETGKGSKGKNLERIGEGANGPFLLPNWRNFATQLGSKFFLVGASIRSISLTAGFILSSEAVFTCDSPNSGNYGIIPYISVPPFTPNVCSILTFSTILGLICQDLVSVLHYIETILGIRGFTRLNLLSDCQINVITNGIGCLPSSFIYLIWLWKRRLFPKG